MAGRDTNIGAKRARDARPDLGLTDDEPVACLLTLVEEAAGLRVVLTDRLPQHVAGACWRDGDRAVLWVNGAQATVRQRFTLAHELGHAHCGHDGRLDVDTFATLSGKTSNPLEVQANAFAAELLVPKAAVADDAVLHEATLEDLVHAAARFGVSAMVVLFRLRTYRLIDDDRAGRLQAEIEEGLHLQLETRPHDDRLRDLDVLPYLSAALVDTALERALRSTHEGPLIQAAGRLLL